MTLLKKYALGALVASLSVAGFAKEHPMGPAQEVYGMEIASVYLQPITMDMQMGLPADESDVHLELDIHATKDNPNTLAEGWWVPYLTVKYQVEKLDKRTKQVQSVQSGELLPMVASDGPHYGINAKLQGEGLYRIKYQVFPPNMNKQVDFGRHIDEETAAPEWFNPFQVEWEFPWAGPGEKGSY